MWEANFLQKKSKAHKTDSVLFDEKPVVFELPALVQHPLDDAIDEIELVGFPLGNVFELVDDDPMKYIHAKDLHLHLGKDISVLGYLIITKPVHTIRNETMYFGTFIDVNGDWLDTIHFPFVESRYPLAGKGFYQMNGKVVEEFGVYSLEVRFLRKTGIRDRAGKANALFPG